MGLDMYVYATDWESINNEMSSPHTLTFKEESSCDRIHYWRKHHDLHGLMEEIYKSKGGTAEFNCIKLPLTEADLDNIERRINTHMLPETTGFFFGNNPPNKETDKQDLEVIAKLREELSTGRVVYYFSWW